MVAKYFEYTGRLRQFTKLATVTNVLCIVCTMLSILCTKKSLKYQFHIATGQCCICFIPSSFLQEGQLPQTGRALAFVYIGQKVWT